MNVAVKELTEKLPYMAESLEEHAETINGQFPWVAHCLRNVIRDLRALHKAQGHG